MAKKYWLLKNEEADYSIDDFRKDKKTLWDGVRNYQARNFIREMKSDDSFIYYHSNGNPSGAAGVGKIISEPYPDPTQFQKKNKYYESRATREKPVWTTVDVQFVEKFKNLVPLEGIKNNKTLKGIVVAKKGNRLSVSPITKQHFDEIARMSK